MICASIICDIIRGFPCFRDFSHIPCIPIYHVYTCFTCSAYKYYGSRSYGHVYMRRLAYAAS